MVLVRTVADRTHGGLSPCPGENVAYESAAEVCEVVSTGL